ncbi:MAG: 5-(carboxyamino)imidazole ribonucleotide mutase [Chloroflexi bacterium]|nr:5-(carboxyamino)imidazole ribonucleotide mutase [Chloroflexota bacterium]
MEPMVGVVIGSENDKELIAPALQMLEDFGVKHELSVISAHRTAEKARSYALTAGERGVEVLIAAAGYAAHLPGVLASWSALPVIGVPLPTSDLKGIDSLLSIVQMPGGVPVACAGIGKSGAKNAALLAIQILAVRDERLRVAYRTYRTNMASQ